MGWLWSGRGWSRRCWCGTLVAAVAVGLLVGGFGAAAPAAQAGPREAPTSAGLRWNLDRIQVQRAWQITKGSPSVTIAIIDTGVDESHPELAGRVVFSADLTGSNQKTPSDFHGTFVAGIAAGAGVEAPGVAPRVSIMSYRVFDRNGNASWESLARAVRDATNRGAKIINMSLGGGIETQGLAEALDYAASQGVLLVCAAGNSGYSAAGSSNVYPASHPRAFGVASLTFDGQLSYYSSAGPWVRVAAPGGDTTSRVGSDPKYQVYGPTPGGGYTYAQGTSFAAPHVAGLAALVWSANPALTRDEVMQVLMRSAEPMGESRPNPKYGWGQVNAWRAVRAALPREPLVNLATRPEQITPNAPATVQGWVRDGRNPQYGLGDLVETVDVYLSGSDGERHWLSQAAKGVPVPDAAATDLGFSFDLDPTTLPADATTVWVGARTLMGDTAWGQLPLSR